MKLYELVGLLHSVYIGGDGVVEVKANEVIITFPNGSVDTVFVNK